MTERTLILMRHAKSDWADPRLDDHDRPLNARGRRAAVALGRWLERGGLKPDEALVSTALRTADTFARLGLNLAPCLEPALYLAEAEGMLAILRRATGRRVLLVAHNPGIADLAAALVDPPPDHPRFADYPTGATLVLRFDTGRWDEIAPGTGQVRDFVVPRDLTG